MNLSWGTQSAWDDVPEIDPGPLPADAVTDVCVVGAGIAGLSVAERLASEGLSVLVLDAGPVGRGMTARTTAHLSNALDDRYVELERLHGRAGTRLAAQSHTAAIERAEGLVRDERIDCDWARVDGFLFLPPGESEDRLRCELEAAQRAGLSDVARLPRAPIARFDTGPCLRFPGQAQFHPLKYLAGLVRSIERRNGRIHTRTRATRVDGGPSPCVATEAGATVRARAIVVATNAPFHDRFALHTKQAPYTTYVIAVPVPAGSLATALYWDTAQCAGAAADAPYHYLRLSGDLLIVGGEDHKTGQAEDFEGRFRRLEAWTRERFPDAGPVRHRWSGQVLEPLDGMAFIGRHGADGDNVYVVSGDSGNGITHGILAGLLIGDLVLGRPNPWAELYDPDRVRLRTALQFAKENLNVAAQLRDHVTAGDLSAESDIAAGSGAVVRHGLTKIAVYRDPTGLLHRCSAVCPHLKCIVRWNAVEKTWDCPCHGSRFDARGRVLVGPAHSDLAPVT